jgi:hypothetical protein
VFRSTTVVKTLTAEPTATTMTVPGLTNGTAYTFTVAAVNAAGTGPAPSAQPASPRQQCRGSHHRNSCTRSRRGRQCSPRDQVTRGTWMSGSSALIAACVAGPGGAGPGSECRPPRGWDHRERVSAAVMGPPGCQ